VLGINHATSAGAFERFPFHRRKKRRALVICTHLRPGRVKRRSSYVMRPISGLDDKRPACRIFDRPRSPVPRGLARPLRSALTDDSGGPANWLMTYVPHSAKQPSRQMQEPTDVEPVSAYPRAPAYLPVECQSIGPLASSQGYNRQWADTAIPFGGSP